MYTTRHIFGFLDRWLLIHSVGAEVFIVIEIGLSLGILYSENRTLVIKDYTKRVSKHDRHDVFFNLIFILLIAISTDC